MDSTDDSTGKNTSGLMPPWQPGQSGNPSGRRKLTEEEKKLRKLTKDAVKVAIDVLVNGNEKELKAIVADEDSTLLEKAFARVIQRVIAKGDMTTLELLLARTTGKVKDELEVTGIKPYVAVLSDGKTIEMGVKETPEK